MSGAQIPVPDYSDMFAPDPKQNRTVKCIHCGDTYSEHEAVYEVRPEMSVFMNGAEPLWWCRNRACEGAGVGFDLFPAEPPFEGGVPAKGGKMRNRVRSLRKRAART